MGQEKKKKDKIMDKKEMKKEKKPKKAAKQAADQKAQIIEEYKNSPEYKKAVKQATKAIAQNRVRQMQFKAAKEIMFGVYKKMMSYTDTAGIAGRRKQKAMAKVFLQSLNTDIPE